MMEWALVVLVLLVALLSWELHRAREEVAELQRQRIEDVKWFAGQSGPREAEVEDVGTPDSRAQEAVQELDERVALQFLRRKAEDEGLSVSDSRLREDAKKLVREWGIGPQSPNL